MRRMSNRRRMKGQIGQLLNCFGNMQLKNCVLWTWHFLSSLFSFFCEWQCVSTAWFFLKACPSNFDVTSHIVKHTRLHIINIFSCSGVPLFSMAGSLWEPTGCSCDFGTRAGTQFWHEPRHPRARLRLQDDCWSGRLHHDPFHRVRFCWSSSYKTVSMKRL